MKERLLLDPESSRKLAACMLKTFNRMKKRVGFLLYQFVLPALQVSLFCLAIEQDPKELPVAVVNAENAGAACVSADAITECPVSLTGTAPDKFMMEDTKETSLFTSTGTFGMPEENEFLANFTCRYLSFMDTDVAQLVYYPTVESAVQAVEDGEAWGVISMEQNFTRDLYQRIFESLV